MDLEVGKWTKVKIVVQDATARLYVHGAAQPTLLVLDLKHGPAQRGGIGLWIGSGTEAYFRNLVVTPAK
ncbi:LamG domain-containing protein [Hymenobacter sp. DG01]|uniref:LamG domain-containing protein n=1 Tax=Hymenobacter sp. DG01 TaxID=2584940 RepID=UPI001122A5BA|nr:LamG domain-containing protein [Hymenobacter sp. DG01]